MAITEVEDSLKSPSTRPTFTIAAIGVSGTCVMPGLTAIDSKLFVCGLEFDHHSSSLSTGASITLPFSGLSQD